MNRLLFAVSGCVLLVCLFQFPAAAGDLSRSILYDIPPDKVEERFGRVIESQLTREDSLRIAAYRFDGDTVKVLVLLVEWSDRPGTYLRETFDSLMFIRDVYPPGSLADYYDEVSYGQMAVTGDVIDWYDAGTFDTYFDFESILPALDPVVDFSQYDGNQDGDVDVVVFLRSGNGMEDTFDPTDIWSYASNYAPGEGPGPYDGVYVSHWTTAPETRPLRKPSNPTEFSGVDTLNRIAVCAHEMGHSLGLPDLYDYDGKLDTVTYRTPDDENDHPLVDWCLMGYGGYGLLSIASLNAKHFCGWSKMQLGWIEPVVLEDFIGEVVINEIDTHNDNALFKLPIDPATGEYFLLEYRNSESDAQFGKFDSDFSVYLPNTLSYGADPLERGLIITHVDDSLAEGYFINNGTPLYPHYSVEVMDAGYNPACDVSCNPEGYVTDSAQWWYPYETRKAAPFTSLVSGKDLFGPSTFPHSDGYGGPTGIVVRVDSLVEGQLYAYVKVPSNNWRVDIGSNTASVGQTDVTLGVTAYWNREMSEIAIPLVVREIDPGAFWGGLLPVDTLGAVSHGVTWNWSNPGWADQVQEVRPGIPQSPCGAEGDMGYDGISPDHLVIHALSSGGGSTSAEPDGREIVTLSFDANDTPGSFEIDTACFSGSMTSIRMVDAVSFADYGPSGPYGEHFMFNKGMVTLYPSVNPNIASTTPRQHELNVPAATDILVTFAAEIDGGTLDNSTIVVHGSLTGRHLGAVSYDDWTRTVTFDPDDVFSVGEVVTVLLTSDIEVTGGGSFGHSYIWSFTVEVTEGAGKFVTDRVYEVGASTDGVITAADLDSDGDIDLARIKDNVPQVVCILLNDGAGTFDFDSTYAIGSNPNGIVAADLDADGYLDLVTTNNTADNISVLMNNGDGTFTPQVTYEVDTDPFDVTAGDFDGDADLDLAVSCGMLYDGTVTVLFNNGDGTFPNPLFHGHYSFGHYLFEISTSDVDNDGALDLIVRNWNGWCIQVLRNDGDGTFGSSFIADLGMGFPNAMAAADLDNDGDLDLPTVGNWSGDPYFVVYSNFGEGVFTSTVSTKLDYGHRAMVTVDVDCDGDLDPTFVCLGPDQVAYFSNDDGSYTTHTVAVAEDPCDLCAADLDGDGDVDLATAHRNSDKVSILFNCDCPGFGDLNLDEAINPVDVVLIVNFVYLGLDLREPIPNCIRDNGDWNCDRGVNPLDVVHYVNYVYLSIGTGPCNPCEP